MMSLSAGVHELRLAVPSMVSGPKRFVPWESICVRTPLRAQVRTAPGLNTMERSMVVRLVPAWKSAVPLGVYSGAVTVSASSNAG